MIRGLSLSLSFRPPRLSQAAARAPSLGPYAVDGIFFPINTTQSAFEELSIELGSGTGETRRKAQTPYVFSSGPGETGKRPALVKHLLPQGSLKEDSLSAAALRDVIHGSHMLTAPQLVCECLDMFGLTSVVQND